MISSPDKLFRNGLGEYHKPAPPDAWERIESGLHRKRQKSLWLKIAASITLLLAVSFFLWPDQEGMYVADTKSNGPTEAIVDNADKVKPEAVPVSPSQSKVNITDQEPKSMIQKPSLSNARQKSQAAGEKKAVEIQQDHKGNLTSGQVDALSDPDPIGTDVTAVSIAQPESYSSRIHLTYSSMEVQSRFRKKDLPVEATPEKKSSSGMQKVMDLAFELKNDDSTYGDLRQKKNEILSFQFIDHRKGPNK